MTAYDRIPALSQGTSPPKIRHTRGIILKNSMMRAPFAAPWPPLPWDAVCAVLAARRCGCLNTTSGHQFVQVFREGRPCHAHALLL